MPFHYLEYGKEPLVSPDQKGRDQEESFKKHKRYPKIDYNTWLGNKFFKYMLNNRPAITILKLLFVVAGLFFIRSFDMNLGYVSAFILATLGFVFLIWGEFLSLISVLGFLDFLSGISMFLLAFGVENLSTLLIWISIYLIFKGFIFAGSKTSMIDLSIGFYVLVYLVGFDLNIILFLASLLLLQKGVLTLFASTG